MKILHRKLGKSRVLWMWLTAAVFFLLGTLCSADPAASTGLAAIADKVTGNLSNLAKLITAGSYVAGMGFAVAAILKFKAHKDNPTQIPVGTPIALVFIASAMIFLPSMFKAAGETLFGNEAETATVSGITDFGAGGNKKASSAPASSDTGPAI